MKSNKLTKRLVFIILLTVSLQSFADTQFPSNQAFRNQVITLVKKVALQQPTQQEVKKFNQLEILSFPRSYNTNWSLSITVYHDGKEIGKSFVHGTLLSKVIIDATQNALQHIPKNSITSDNINSYRFKVAFFYYPYQVYSFISYGNQGLELTGNLVAVRLLTRQKILEQINQSKDYLLSVMNPEYYGFFKLYKADIDDRQTKLRTIYSASTLYTLMNIYGLEKNSKLERYFKPIAKFILSKQVHSGKNAGGFYYGFEPDTKQIRCLLSVGTTSKVIFTLLRLNQFYPNDEVYLQSAIKAGNWLVTRVQSDGKVIPITACRNGKTYDKTGQSLLYSGQVLSALSQLYEVTKDKKYLNAADKIANYFEKEMARQGYFLADDYRPANAISTSWVLMSLIQYSHSSSNKQFQKSIVNLTNHLLANQYINSDFIFRFGRYVNATTTSGNGWLNEVMASNYQYCITNQLDYCERVKKAMILTSRWLLQNVYSEANTFNIKNPSRAIGGFRTSFKFHNVRTDAVCHGINSLVDLYKITNTGNNVLLSAPETPFEKLYPLLRMGNQPKVDYTVPLQKPIHSK